MSLFTVRNAQLDVLAGARAAMFLEQLAELLWREWAPRCPGLGQDDLRVLLDFSARTCAEQGLTRQGAVIDFSQSMLKDDTHPMTADHMTEKAQAILRDLRTRALFERLQSVDTGRPRPQAAAAGDALQQE